MSAGRAHPSYARWREETGRELVPLLLACDICSGESFTTLRETVDGGHGAPPAHLPVVACDRCGCILQSIRFDSGFYDWYYRSEYRQGLFGTGAVPPAFIEDQRRRGAALLDSLEPLLPERGSLLDVGCSAGATMLPFFERGWDVFGVDPDAVYVAYGRDVLGLPVAVAAAEELRLDGRYDLIIILGSLEHVADPALVLRLLRDAAHCDTLLVVEGFGLGQSRLRGRFGLNHRRYFTLTSVELLLEAHGWTPFRTTRDPLCGPTRPGSVFCLARPGLPLTGTDLLARIDAGKRDATADLRDLLDEFGIEG